MDPVTLVATAVAVGAAAGATDTAKPSVADAYSALQSLIIRRYRHANPAPVENAPVSTDARASLAAALADGGADDDDELLSRARELITAVRATDANAATAIGVDLANVEAAALRIQEVRAAGSGVKVRDSRFSGDIDIRDIDAGSSEPPHPA